MGPRFHAYRGVSLPTSAPAGVVDQEQTSDDGNVSESSYPSGIGQSVTFGNSPSEVSGLRVRMRHTTANKQGLLRFAVYAQSSDLPTGSPLATSPFYATDISNSEADYYPVLSAWTPAANTKYVIVAEFFEHFQDATNGIVIRIQSGDAYAGGKTIRRASPIYGSQVDIGTGFSVLSTGTSDWNFAVYSASGSTAGEPHILCAGNAVGSLLVSQVADPTTATNTTNWSGGYYRIGFLFDVGNYTTINGFCMGLSRGGTPTALFTPKINQIMGAVEDAELTAAATASGAAYDLSGIATSITTYWFPFSSPVDVSSWDKFFIYLERQDIAYDVSNRVNLGVDDTSGSGYLLKQVVNLNGFVPTPSDSQEVVFRLYGTETSITEDPITSIDFGSRTVITISNILSADETEALKVDVSQLLPEEGTGRPVREVSIEQIKATTSGVDVDILWDATSPEHCLSISGDSGIDWDFRAVGPLTNNAGAGKTGNILFSTNGATAGSSYSVTLVMRKKY